MIESKEGKWHRYKNGFNYYNPSHKRMYHIWFDMKRRCYQTQNKRYNRYGAKGISVCAEWVNNFQAFFDWSLQNGYDDKLTLDRIDMRGDYCPSNCRWADAITQANNRSNNHFITYKNETKTMMEWSRLLGINYSTIRQRVRQGWDVDKVFEAPIGRWRCDK